MVVVLKAAFAYPWFHFSMSAFLRVADLMNVGRSGGRGSLASVALRVGTWLGIVNLH